MITVAMRAKTVATRPEVDNSNSKSSNAKCIQPYRMQTKPLFYTRRREIGGSKLPTVARPSVAAASSSSPPMDAASQTMLVMKVRKEPKEAIKVSEVTASHYIMCKSPWSFFHQLQYMQQPAAAAAAWPIYVVCNGECLMLYHSP